jgi:hypothetical protein
VGEGTRTAIDAGGGHICFRDRADRSLLHGIDILATVVEISEEKKVGILNWFGDHERFGLQTAEANRQFGPRPIKPGA